MRVAIYPGSFDPITNGHLDIITRGSKIFDKLIVGVLVNVDKVGLFEIEERVELVATERGPDCTLQTVFRLRLAEDS